MTRKKMTGSSCICHICGREYIYNRHKGHTTTKCGSCSVNERRFNLRIKILDQMGNKCSVCGYNKCNDALEIHHIDAALKEFTISGSHCRKWSVILEELKKCILLCSNCHRELHAKKREEI